MKTEEETMSKAGDGKIELWAVVALGVSGDACAACDYREHLSPNETGDPIA